MRYERLILEAGPNAVTVRFHPRLTVIAGVGRAERDGLVGELLGALAGGRSGAHLEVVDDGGRRLAVIRRGAVDGDRVIDAESGVDVTEEFVDADGRLDLLASIGLRLDDVRRRSRLTGAEVAALGRTDAMVDALAARDQAELWDAAEQLVTADAELKAEAAPLGASAEDAPVIEEVERRHREFEDAQRRHEQVRHHGIFIGGACALGSIPAALLNRFYGLPFLGVALITTLVSVIVRRKMGAARRAEEDALAAAGASSYLGFQLQRVNGLLEGTGARRQRLAALAVAHREASDRWRMASGDVSLEWALGMRDKVVAAARRAGDATAGVGGGQGAIEPAELAQAFVSRLADLRHAGRDGESIPLVLDEPLTGLEPSVKRWMLELVGRSAGAPQVVYLTADPDVAAWARMEAVGGQLSVIEPAPEHETPALQMVDKAS